MSLKCLVAKGRHKEGHNCGKSTAPLRIREHRAERKAMATGYLEWAYATT